MNVALIPARGGSLRIPRKNVRMFRGRPIIAYSIEAARASRLFQSVVVSTDDDDIAAVAKTYGADVIRRGPEWAEESVGPLDVARHSLQDINASLMCVIYATAPLMAVSDLVRGYSLVQREGVAYSFSVGCVPDLHDAAQFFWCRAWALQERVPEFGEYTAMVPIHHSRDCDINTERDWLRAELLYAALQKEAA